jgi:hypothetical protein
VGNKELFFAGRAGYGTYLWDWRYSGWNSTDHLRALFFEEAEEYKLPVICKATLRLLFFAFSAILASLPTSARACAACYGQSDSPLASGVTWGILSLLVVVMAVLSSIVSFFVYIHRRAAAAISQNPITDYQSQFTNH